MAISVQNIKILPVDNQVNCPAYIRDFIIKKRDGAFGKDYSRSILGNSIRIMEAQISETSLRATKPDVVIRPPVGHLSFMEFHRAGEAIEAGYETAREMLREVPGRLERG